MTTDPTASGRDDLPYVDEHRVRIAAPPDVVWTALERYVASTLSVPRRTLFRRALGTVPTAGFEVSGRVPEQRLTLTGEHRFSRYRLEFVLADGGDGTAELRALTHAVFPGRRGRAYRALVVGSRAHVVATTHILRSIQQLSVDPAIGRGSGSGSG